MYNVIFSYKLWLIFVILVHFETGMNTLELNTCWRYETISVTHRTFTHNKFIDFQR